MSKLWILLLLAVFVCLLLDCEAQDSTRRRNRNRNRDSSDVEFNAGAGGRGNRRGNAGGRRRPGAGGAGRGRGQRGRGQGGRGQGGRGRGRARGGSMLTEATRPFALSLYKELASTEPNVVVSTYSILTALSMVTLGAQRQTEDELRTVMGVSSMRPRKAHRAFHTLAQALAASASGNVTLNQANALFARQGLRIRNGFNRKLRKFYNAEMQNFDMNNPEGPEKPINDWVAMKTNDMIQDFLPPRTITPMTLIWILNAIYFKGLWKKPFESRFTRQQPFYISNSDQASVDMMYMEDDFALGHSSELQARVLEVPYGGDSVSMFILLPEEIEGLAFLESNLTPERLEQALTGLYSQKVQLSLPKMKVEFEADLKEPLQRLGIRRMFDRSQAELGGMLAGRTQQVYVSDGKHKAVLEVTEEGTAAAAVTGFGITLLSAPMPPLQFNANHPFMFVVRDKVNNVNLFVGKYSDPRRAM